jgi:hypothetical protein
LSWVNHVSAARCAGPLSLEYEGHGGDTWAKSVAVPDLAKSVLGKEASS